MSCKYTGVSILSLTLQCFLHSNVEFYVNCYLQHSIATKTSSLKVSNNIVFSLSGDSINNVLSKPALQVVLANLFQSTQTINVPITALQKLSSCYSYLGFLGGVISDIQTQLNNCITSILPILAC